MEREIHPPTEATHSADSLLRGSDRSEIEPQQRRNPLASRILLWSIKRNHRLIHRAMCVLLGSDFLCREFGSGLTLPHPYGIVVHSAVRLGANCRIEQNVTIGAHNRKWGVAIIGDDVMIGAGAAVVGPVTIGSHAFIGANAVVTDDVPAGAVAVGVPARVIGYWDRERDQTRIHGVDKP